MPAVRLNGRTSRPRRCGCRLPVRRTGHDRATINDSTLTMSFRQALRTGKVNRVPVMRNRPRQEPGRRPDHGQRVRSKWSDPVRQVRQPGARPLPVSRFDSPYVAFRTVAADSNTVCPSIVTDQELARQMPVYGYLITDNDIPPYALTGLPLVLGASRGIPRGSLVPQPGQPGSWMLTSRSLQNQEVAEVDHVRRAPATRRRPGLAGLAQLQPLRRPNGTGARR